MSVSLHAQIMRALRQGAALSTTATAASLMLLGCSGEDASDDKRPGWQVNNTNNTNNIQPKCPDDQALPVIPSEQYPRELFNDFQGSPPPQGRYLVCASPQELSAANTTCEGILNTKDYDLLTRIAVGGSSGCGIYPQVRDYETTCGPARDAFEQARAGAHAGHHEATRSWPQAQGLSDATLGLMEHGCSPDHVIERWRAKALEQIVWPCAQDLLEALDAPAQAAHA